MNLKDEIFGLVSEIDAEVNHGECFYDDDMYRDFIRVIDELKEISKKFYEINKAEEDK